MKFFKALNIISRTSLIARALLPMTSLQYEFYRLDYKLSDLTCTWQYVRVKEVEVYGE